MTENGANGKDFPWELGSATGIGSMPGTDPAAAARVVVDELPDFPFLPELPGRGPGADLIGRTAALLIDIPVETVPTGWRVAERPGRTLRAAQSMLSSDLDALEEQLAGYRGAAEDQPGRAVDPGRQHRAQDPQPGAVRRRRRRPT